MSKPDDKNTRRKWDVKEEALIIKARHPHQSRKEGDITVFELHPGDALLTSDQVEKVLGALKALRGVPVYEKTGNNIPPANEVIKLIENARIK